MSDAPTTTGAGAPVTSAGAPAAGGGYAAGSCRACSAPLAADQRYCLNCGARAAAPRVELPAAPAGAEGPAATGATAAGAGGGAPRFGQLVERVGGPMGAAAVVLVALAVGFLLGQGGDSAGGPATVIQRPPVINVQGGGAAAETTGANADASPRGGGGGAGGGSGKAAGKAASTEGIPKATEDSAGGDLDRLQQQPTEQATEGPPPRTDDKPAGGGTEAETIG